MTVYVALVDQDYNNYTVTGVYADLDHAKAAAAADCERPGRTLEWRESGESWDLYALGEGGRGVVRHGNPDRYLDRTIEAHELHQATTEDSA